MLTFLEHLEIDILVGRRKALPSSYDAALVVAECFAGHRRGDRRGSNPRTADGVPKARACCNGRPMRRLGVSRRQLFDELDRPALAALPVEPYVYAEWRQRRVALDYHVDVDGHYYSVPHRLLRQQVEARITERTVELFHKGERVACHLLGGARGRHTTVTEHMPSAHRRYAGWTHERIQREAAAIGNDTATLVEVILRSRPHPEQGFRACLGILRLARQYGVERLEAACRRGLEIGARSYGSINSILQNGLDRQPPMRPAEAPELPLDHPNIRGSRYYH